MANDFSADANCVALYNFESGNLLVDSKLTNTLTDVNTVEEDTVNYKQGACSADFERGNSEYFYRTDANLTAGFPGKGSGGSTDFSLCFWIRGEDFHESCPVGKWETVGKRAWVCLVYPVKIYVSIGYNEGVNSIGTTHGGVLSNGVWYHVGIMYDYDGGADSKGKVGIRVWDDNAQAILQSDGEDTYWADLGQQMSLTEADLTVGVRNTADLRYYLDGILDELVIFKDVLTEAEIDQVRAGTYGIVPEINIPAVTYYYNMLRAS